MKVYRELGEVRFEIERIAATTNKLEDRVALSTIDLFLVTSETPSASLGDAWDPLALVDESVTLLVLGLQVLASALIFAVIAVGPFGVMAYIAWRFWKRHRASRP